MCINFVCFLPFKRLEIRGRNFNFKIGKLCFKCRNWIVFPFSFFLLPFLFCLLFLINLINKFRQPFKITRALTWTNNYGHTKIIKMMNSIIHNFIISHCFSPLLIYEEINVKRSFFWLMTTNKMNEIVCLMKASFNVNKT